MEKTKIDFFYNVVVVVIILLMAMLSSCTSHKQAVCEEYFVTSQALLDTLDSDLHWYQDSEESTQKLDYYEAIELILYDDKAEENWYKYFNATEALLIYLDNKCDWTDGFGGDYVIDYQNSRKKMKELWQE